MRIDCICQFENFLKHSIFRYSGIVKEELEQLILNTPYPNKEYIPIDIEPIEEKPLSEYEEKQLAYKNKKNEQLKQLRKEHYQKYKQSKKK